MCKRRKLAVQVFLDIAHFRNTLFEFLHAPLHIRGFKQVRLTAHDFGQGLRFTGRDSTLADGCQDELEVGREVQRVLDRKSVV